MVLFREGYFPLNVKKSDEALWLWLIDLKTHPERYNKEELNKRVDEYEVKLKDAYDTRKFFYTFDYDLANEMLREAYLPYLTK